MKGNPDVFCSIAAKAVGRESMIRTLNLHCFPKLQHVKGSTGWMKLVMGPAQTLHGRVRNSKGEPIEGASVYTQTQPLSSAPLDGFCCAKTDKSGEYKITDLKAWVRPKDAGKIRVTSRQGRAVGRSVPDHFIVHVWHPEYGQEWAEGRELPGELNVEVPEVGIISGRAIDATTKAPMAGVSILAEAQSTAEIDWQSKYCANWTITDSQGNYRMALRAGNDYLVFANFAGFVSRKFPRIGKLRATGVTVVNDLTLVRAGVVRAHLIDEASQRRIIFAAKPQVSVLVRSEPKSSIEDEIPAEFAEGSAFLMRAAIPGYIYSIYLESNDPTISPSPGVTAFNVQPGETVEIDLPVDVTKPAVTNPEANHGKP